MVPPCELRALSNEERFEVFNRKDREARKGRRRFFNLCDLGALGGEFTR